MPLDYDNELALAEENLKRDIENSKVVVSKIQHKGTCHYCHEPVEEPKLFCNGECADDHDKYGPELL